VEEGGGDSNSWSGQVKSKTEY